MIFYCTSGFGAKAGFNPRKNMRLKTEFTSHRNKTRPIFESLRRDILDGRFRSHANLPGSRALAQELGVSRGTINLALAMLAAWTVPLGLAELTIADVEASDASVDEFVE